MTAQALNVSVADEQPGSYSDLHSKSVADGSTQVWKPGVWVRLPWFGFGSLLIIFLRRFLLCPSFGTENDTSFTIDLCWSSCWNIVTLTSVEVIALSDNHIVEEWKGWNIQLQPQIWLAIFSTIINAMLGFSLIEGLKIHFWKRASRGITVSLKLFFNFYARIYVKLMNAFDPSCVKCMICINLCHFSVPWTR